MDLVTTTEVISNAIIFSDLSPIIQLLPDICRNKRVIEKEHTCSFKERLLFTSRINLAMHVSSGLGCSQSLRGMMEGDAISGVLHQFV